MGWFQSMPFLCMVVCWHDNNILGPILLTLFLSLIGTHEAFHEIVIDKITLLGPKIVCQQTLTNNKVEGPYIVYVQDA